MFNSFLSLFGISSLARNTVLDDTDFTYRVKNFSISNNEETKIEETFVTSVINPVENYEGLSVESTIKKSEETFVKTVINPIKNNQETLHIESSIINTPTEVKEETLPIESSIINTPTEVKEEIKHVHSGQDYEHYLKAIQLELETSSEEEIEDNPIEPNDVRCSNCNNYHDELSSESDEEVLEDEKPLTFKEYRGEYLYSIIVDKKVLGYIDDHKQLLEYLTIIKKRIHNSYQYDGTFKYWMKYFWNETVMFDWNNDLVVKYSLVSMNTHNLLSYDRLETTLTVYRMKNLLIK
jgi:hypothetical protein